MYSSIGFAGNNVASDAHKTHSSAIETARVQLAFPDTYRRYQQDFVNALLPAIRTNNQRLTNDRAHIAYLQRQFEQRQALSVHDQLWLLGLADTYRIKETTVNAALFKQLRLKVDIVPVELVLAQGAIESAWGRSRFAKEGNNFFGVWCYSRGCGVVPAQRPAGQTQEVRRYANAAESVAHYMLTLNRVKAYKSLRQVRQKQRKNGNAPTGHTMAAGLSKYSAKGWQYVKDVRSVMRKYQFEQLQHQTPQTHTAGHHFH